jgi:chromatin structure-remodeling complex protein RSC7
VSLEVNSKAARRLTHLRSGTPTPKNVEEDSDEEMADGDAVEEDLQDATLLDEDDDNAATPAADEDDDEDGEEDDEDNSPPKVTSIPRRRGRGGRGRGGRMNSHNTPEPGGEGSESGTPMRRRRGRPPGSGLGRGRGGFRGRRKGQATEAPRFIVDKEGNQLDVVDDEAQVDDDLEGNEKVDSSGHLQGGREYRVRTFTIMGREDRLYMLSTEPARCCGFRDSYLFFTKHPKLYKVLIGEDEKKDLIERDILPNSYKGRNIGVVTARSVFREFGARIVVGGRRIIDDYKVAEARENGEVEGELADPDDLVPSNIADYNRNRYVAWFGASEVYRTQTASGAAQVGKQSVLGKRRNNVTLENWQTLHATEARYVWIIIFVVCSGELTMSYRSRFNSTLSAIRKSNLDGVYDNNTNMIFYPKIMQPTHAAWEYIEPSSTQIMSPRGDAQNGHLLTNGDAHDHHHDNVTHSGSALTQPTIFTEVPDVVSRNFTVTDIVYQAPPIDGASEPGPDGLMDASSFGPSGLGGIDQDVIDELPEDCRTAFEAARSAETRWRQQWGTEAHSSQRGTLKIGFNGYPV